MRTNEQLLAAINAQTITTRMIRIFVVVIVVLGIAIFVVQTVRHRGEPDSSPFTVTPQQRQDAEALSPAGS